MKRSLLLFAALVLGCASQKDNTKSDAQTSSPDAGMSKLQEAAEVGRMAADYPPKSPQCPPPTRREEVTETLFGEKVTDSYRWLEDEKSPEVQQWMAAEDKCARQALSRMPNRDVLQKRFKQLYYVDSVSAPVKRGNRYFYVRTHADKEKAIVYWREGEKGEEKVLLDPNKWSAEGTISLGTWVPSWDGKKVVFTRKPNAADEATLYVLDVDSNKESDEITGAKYASPDWLPDNSGFYYEWLPTDANIPVAERPGYTELRLHNLGADPKTDALVHEKTGDPSTFLEGQLSRDGKYLFVYVIRGWSENDVYLQKVGKQKDFTLLVKGKDAQYGVDAWKDQFYIVTDEGAPKQHVFKVSAAKPERKNWKEIVKEDKDATLDGMNIVGGMLSLSYLKDASTEIRLTSLDGKPARKVQLPLDIGVASNLIGLQDQDEAFYSFSSFTLPRQVYKTSISKGGQELWAKVELPIDPTPYTVTLVRYPSKAKDGAMIPMFLVHRKDVQKNGENPVLLYGYGGFNISMQPYFKASIYPWLEAGGIYAVALLRGGGEYGKEWHDAGKREHKQNVFDDFAGAAEFLAKEKYSRAEKIAINGGSNGGLLVGTAMVQHPELYGGVVCQVPLLDMIRYTKFGSGKTWIPEYGSADVEADFKFISAYSPYQHIKDGTTYPPLLMMSADHDDRVDPMHARKFVAAIQHASPKTPALLRIETNAGHGGADQVKKSIDASADAYAFMFQILGMHPAGEAAPTR